jgi:sec-independent protein translocase protein TatB
MFGLGFGEIVIIAILALILLGPDKLPDAAKTLGKTLREIRRHTDDLKEQFEAELDLNDRKKIRPALVPPVPTVPGTPAGPPPAATVENVPGLEAALADLGDDAAPDAGAPAPTTPTTPPGASAT